MSKKQPWDNALVKNLCVKISSFDLPIDNEYYRINPITGLVEAYVKYSILNRDKHQILSQIKDIKDKCQSMQNHARDRQLVKHSLKLLASRDVKSTSTGRYIAIVKELSNDILDQNIPISLDALSAKLTKVNESLAEITSKIVNFIYESQEVYVKFEYTDIQHKTIGQFLKLMSRNFIKRASIQKHLKRMERMNESNLGRVYNEIDFSSLGLVDDEETCFDIISREISLAFYAFSLTERCTIHPFTIMEDAVDFLLDPLTINYGEQRASNIVQEVFLRVQQHILAYEQYDVCPPPKQYIEEVNNLLAEQANVHKLLLQVKRSATGHALISKTEQEITQELHAKETQMVSSVMPLNCDEINLRSYFVQSCYKKLAMGYSKSLNETGESNQSQVLSKKVA